MNTALMDKNYEELRQYDITIAMLRKKHLQFDVLMLDYEAERARRIKAEKTVGLRDSKIISLEEEIRINSTQYEDVEKYYKKTARRKKWNGILLGGAIGASVMAILFGVLGG